jgi:hypothetical protein|tara:strand:- start:60 stop:233 length:174 start_codon:yes stop_codon:yes gene_type:complete
MQINMTKEQAAHIEKYKALYVRLSVVENNMAELKKEADKLLAELEVLRTEEEKLFEK